MSETIEALPDFLAPGLKLVICGASASKQAAAMGHYFASRGDRLWSALAEVGLAPPLRPEQDRELLRHGIGLTLLVKRPCGRGLDEEPNDADRARLRRVVEEHAPRLLAFNGKKPAQAFLEQPVPYGLLEDRIGTTRLFVLPSTSPAARGAFDLEPWRQLAELVG